MAILMASIAGKLVIMLVSPFVQLNGMWSVLRIA